MNATAHQPYKNSHFFESDDDKTATEDTTTSTEDTATAKDGDPAQGNISPDNRQLSPEEQTYKGRYDNLKTHYDRQITDFKQKVSALEKQVVAASNKSIPLPKSKEEIAKWRQEFPDVYDLVTSIAHIVADERVQTVNRNMEILERDRADLRKQKAEQDLLKRHPDFNELKMDKDFHDWAKAQPAAIQSWLYDNNDDAELCARAIDLYKRDRGFDKSKPAKKSEAADTAATHVKPKEKVTEPETKSGRVWKLSEIRKLNSREFEKHEADIDKAQREGRIVDDLV